MRVPINISVNGEEYHLEVKPNRVLLDVLREDLGLTGTKKGAGWANAGPARFCWTADRFIPVCCWPPKRMERQITTIEGIAAEEPHPLQAAFVAKGARSVRFLHARNDQCRQSPA